MERQTLVFVTERETKNTVRFLRLPPETRTLSGATRQNLALEAARPSGPIALRLSNGLHFELSAPALLHATDDHADVAHALFVPAGREPVGRVAHRCLLRRRKSARALPDNS